MSIEAIQAQHTEVTTQHTGQTDYLVKIRDSIAKLHTEEQVVIKNIDTLSGAIQAYSNTIQLLKAQTIEE